MRFSVQIVQCSSKSFREEKRKNENQRESANQVLFVLLRNTTTIRIRSRKIYKWQKKMTQIPLTEIILSLWIFSPATSLYHYTIALACIYNLVSGLFPALRMFHFFPHFASYQSIKICIGFLPSFRFAASRRLSTMIFFPSFPILFLSLSFFYMCVYIIWFTECAAVLIPFALQSSSFVSLTSIHPSPNTFIKIVLPIQMYADCEPQ